MVFHYFRRGPWTRKTMKIKSVSLLPGWSMGQENHWVSIVPITFGRVHGPENKLKFIGFPLLSGWSMDQTNPWNSLLLHYLRGSPWMKKIIAIAWFSINCEDNHGPRKSMKVLSFQLLSGRLMGQELHWNFLILRYFRTGPWRRKAIETLWFSISFGVIHGTENLMNFKGFPLLAGWSMDKKINAIP